LFDCWNYLSFHRNEKDPVKPANQPDFQEIQNSELYNAMIYPYSRMVLTGILWYQGRVIEKVAICLML